MKKPIRIERVAVIADRFDAAILDQWGVLTDGAKAPPGACAAVAALHAAGKRLVVLSNSARAGDASLERLARLGYVVEAFGGIVTSGATVREMLRDRRDPFFAGLGSSVLLIARDGTLLEDLPYRLADRPEDADFLLLGSSTAPEMSLAADHAPVLARAAAAGLPALCANPDRVGIAATGFIEGPGTLARHYETLGGTVRYVGKPYPEVYARAMALLGEPDPARVIAIGDSLEHDIAGGRNAGCATLLIESGIHADDVASDGGLDRLVARYRVSPDFIAPRLAW
jgi:HAD superfamily hydrolase (TIGR01459 family)